jgi:hypothetical protein
MKSNACMHAVSIDRNGVTTSCWLAAEGFPTRKRIDNREGWRDRQIALASEMELCVYSMAASWLTADRPIGGCYIGTGCQYNSTMWIKIRSLLLVFTPWIFLHNESNPHRPSRWAEYSPWLMATCEVDQRNRQAKAQIKAVVLLQGNILMTTKKEVRKK